MTYCLGMLLDSGLIMIADTRTNAGVDDISSYRKLHVLADTPERSIFAASAGNLSTTQMAISLLREGVPPADGEAIGPDELLPTIAEPTTMFRAAQLVGEAVKFANDTVGRALAPLKISASSSISVRPASSARGSVTSPRRRASWRRSSRTANARAASIQAVSASGAG